MNWNEWVLTNEVAIRLGFFFGVFAIMASWELYAPRRALTVSKGVRWLNNLGLVFLNSFVLRILFPTAAIGVAAVVQQNGWGLLNIYAVPFVPAVLLAVIAMDFIIYLQHVMFHAIPLLWRLHRVHHADLDYDVTTGARFHTIEIVLSLLIKFAVILLLGPPVVAVVIFEVILSSAAMFNHSNISLPSGIDRVVRWFLVTPDMHRVHHSVEDNEANSNYGFNLPWWDRIFGTYIDQPRKGHDAMSIGIHKHRDPKKVNQLPGMLLLPFIGKISGYAINRREWNNQDDS